MTQNIVEVGFQYVSDLYFRVRHACLESEIYKLDFLDWIKAGIAYNVRGISEPTRKIAYFVDIYEKINSSVSDIGISDLKLAVRRYYEDLFEIYQEHLLAQLQIAHRVQKVDNTEPRNLILLPSFEKTPLLLSLLPMKEIVLMEYECQNLDEFYRVMSTVYAVEGSPLFRCMSLFFDYGVQGESDGVLLGVK